MFGLGSTEIILIAIVILVFFGARKIPDMMKGVARGMKDFKKELKSVDENIKL